MGEDFYIYLLTKDLNRVNHVQQLQSLLTPTPEASVVNRESVL